jgi:DNA-binding NarL/FixJ family response regulator
MDGRRKGRITRPSHPPGADGDRRERRVLIVDDHTMVRQGLRDVIENEEGLVVCGEAKSPREAHFAIRESGPDAMIVELNLRQGAGITLVRDVRSRYPTLAILVFSMHDEATFAERMLSCGADGYVMKQMSTEQLLNSLWYVLDGGTYVSDSVRDNMIRKAAAGRSYRSANPIDRLSIQELQILLMIGEGMSTRDIALSLNLSIKTVDSYRQRLTRKLNLESGSQLVRYALEWFGSSEAGRRLS